MDYCFSYNVILVLTFDDWFMYDDFRWQKNMHLGGKMLSQRSRQRSCWMKVSIFKLELISYFFRNSMERPLTYFNIMPMTPFCSLLIDAGIVVIDELYHSSELSSSLQDLVQLQKVIYVFHQKFKPVQANISIPFFANYLLLRIYVEYQWWNSIHLL